MGTSACCASKDFEFSNTSSDWTRVIERSDLKSLSRLIQTLPKQDLAIDDLLIHIKNISLTPLSYSLLSGKRLIVKFLYDKGASLDKMDQNLATYNLVAIDVICEKDYTELLEFYLPLYLKNLEDSSNRTEIIESSLNLGNYSEASPVNYSTPTQKACEKGNISVIVFIYRYFKNKKFIPRSFDINYPNEKTGETCALIACRKGNFAMVKALHKLCQADFFVKNRYEENAILISVCAYKFDKKGEYLSIIKYLIEKIGVDLEYMHEEVLMLSNCEELTFYIEQQLVLKKIYLTKEEVDLKFGMNKNKFSESFESNSSVEFINSTLRRYLDDNETKSRLSTITYVESKTDLIFASIFSTT